MRLTCYQTIKIDGALKYSGNKARLLSSGQIVFPTKGCKC